MPFSWDAWPRPIIALAPLAGWTDSAYRQTVKKLTDGIVCFSELTSVAALHHKSEGTYRMLDWDPSEFPLIMQLFGKEVEFFVEGGKILEDMGVAGIDINMGCPTCKITSNECGSALLKNPQLAAEIVYNLSRAVSVPVSVKTRLGFDCYEEKRFLDFCTGVQDAGAKLLTLHGRTRKQAFSGVADWNPIYLAKSVLKIPIIGNGDIVSVDDVFARRQTLDGVMIGRATLGNPWLIAEIVAAIRGETYVRPKDIWEKLPLIRDHFALAVEIMGEQHGMKEMRKHLAAYFKGFFGASGYTQKVMEARSAAAVVAVFDEIELAAKPELAIA